MSSFAQFLSKVGREGGVPGAILAPMSGVTDIGMRRAAQRFGASLVVSEMVDSAYYTARDAAAQIKAEGRGIDCHVIQLAGCRAESMAAAAHLAEAEGAAAIDINMGCPAKKVVGGASGSALMRDLDHAIGLVRAVVGAVKVPVSLKMRLGWDDASRNAAELAHRAETEGVTMITVHGRTRCQFYKGAADWAAIRAVVDAVGIPVVANGDCNSVADARAMIARSGAAAVMIGRRAIGCPWLVGDIAHALARGHERPLPSRADRRNAVLDHYESLLSRYGRDTGVRHARKHLAGYATHLGFAAGSPTHLALVTERDPDAVLALLGTMFDQAPLEMAA